MIIEILGVSTEHATILFIVAVLAGFINTVAGGGGLLSIPALMWVGLPPTVVLGTNKLQACGGSFSASYFFVRKGIVNLKEMKLAIFCAFTGSILGTIAVQQIDTAILKSIIPFLILGIGAYFLFSKKIAAEDNKQIVGPTLFAFIIALSLGFYDGFFGPGVGSFLTLAFVSLAGHNLIKATAHAKVLNFSSNIAALISFAIAGKVLWILGISMLIGQVIGGTLGSKMVVTKGVKFIRPLMVTMSIAMSAKLLLLS
ncbi:TSUP family transporter [Psychromonas sp. PT13]|uniref:TSUP family transporter n=1 Tax=Psychromonas sp. PT13 TaxID=3439547 RepID=UPI003EBD6B44